LLDSQPFGLSIIELAEGWKRLVVGDAEGLGHTGHVRKQKRHDNVAASALPNVE